MSMRALEREEDILEREYEDGGMSLSEYHRAIRELHRDFEADMREEAEMAAEEVRESYGMGRW